MKIAIIGAGFTGLAAAYVLAKKHHEVTVFEQDDKPGGLAMGYQEDKWTWSLEKHYHHWFTNDYNILNLAKEIGHEVITKRPKTSVYVNGKIYQLDSPLSVLRFPQLSIFARLRMGITIAMFKIDPFWKALEKYNASQVLPKLMGQKAYQMIWEPLFINKFGEYAGNVSLAWFWARIKKRTPALAYPKGGFLQFAQAFAKAVEKNGGKILFETEVVKLSSTGKPEISFKNKEAKIKNERFDAIIVTLPSFIFLKIAKDLPKEYQQKLRQLKHLGATNLVLRLSQPFFSDGTYWLNVCDKTAPVMAIVEHTNFMDKQNYNGEYLLYLGNYKAADDVFFSMTKEEILKLFDPYLKRVNPNYAKSLIGSEFFKNPFAQPVIPVNYSKIIPPFATPLPNVFLGNIEQVYPWDRGTNYAVELGEKIADYVIKNA